MPGFMPGIHVLFSGKDVDGRGIGERSDAVLRTAMRGHDGQNAPARRSVVIYRTPASSFSLATNSATDPTLVPDLRPAGSAVLRTCSRGAISTP